MGDPADHAIEILWVTSAACKTDSSMAATPESKCYTISAYEEDGVKAKMVDLSHLIQTSGYEVAHPESKQGRFLLGVCRPIQSGTYPQCNGSMACLIQADPSYDLGGASVPLKLATINASQTSLEIESNFPRVTYIGEKPSGCDSERKVKVIYQCPTGSEVSVRSSVSLLNFMLATSSGAWIVVVFVLWVQCTALSLKVL